MIENNNIEPNFVNQTPQYQAKTSGDFPVCENIDDVSKSVSLYLKKHPLKIILIIAAFFALIFFLYSLNLSINNFYIIAFFLMAIFSVYASVQKKLQRQFMQQFAQQNNFLYSAAGSSAEYNGTIFRYGHSQKTSNHISGTYRNCPINLFNYQYSVGYGKQRTTHYYTIFSLHFHTITPNFLLENKMHQFRHGLFADDNNGKHITLEGNFNNFFSLRVAPGDEIETLQILTPDVMEELIEKAKHLSVEIIDNHFYIYANKTIGNKNELYEVYDLAKYFIEKLTPLLQRMKNGLEQEAKEKNYS